MMPRLARSLFRRSGGISPHLATLLPACRTIKSAQSELRWIRGHVLDSLPGPGSRQTTEKNLSSARRSRPSHDAVEKRVARLVARRGAGEPLQYILGTQPFGDLDILCEKGVLIPRPETEAWVATLADLALLSPSSSSSRARVDDGEGGELRILDLCSGTGCIGLSLYAHGMPSRVRRGAVRWGAREMTTEQSGGPALRVFGFDVEPRAVCLGRKNLRHNFHGPRSSESTHSGLLEDVEKAVTFEQADIFSDEWMASLDDNNNDDNNNNNNNDNNPPAYEDEDEGKHPRPRRRIIDILVSNPPYISQRGFETDTGRNVRNYEPKLALVPSPSLSPSPTTRFPEDIFYTRLLEVADTVCPRIVALEVGDIAQAIRVVEMAISRRHQPDPDYNTKRKEEEGEEDGDVARWDVVEIWRDWPDCAPSKGAEEEKEDIFTICGRKVPVRGSGHGRVVFLSEGPIPRNRFTNRGFRRAFYHMGDLTGDPTEGDTMLAIVSTIFM